MHWTLVTSFQTRPPLGFSTNELIGALTARRGSRSDAKDRPEPKVLLWVSGPSVQSSGTSWLSQGAQRLCHLTHLFSAWVPYLRLAPPLTQVTEPETTDSCRPTRVPPPPSPAPPSLNLHHCGGSILPGPSTCLGLLLPTDQSVLLGGSCLLL